VVLATVHERIMMLSWSCCRAYDMYATTKTVEVFGNGVLIFAFKLRLLDFARAASAQCPLDGIGAPIGASHGIAASTSFRRGESVRFLMGDEGKHFAADRKRMRCVC